MIVVEILIGIVLAIALGWLGNKLVFGKDDDPNSGWSISGW